MSTTPHALGSTPLAAQSPLQLPAASPLAAHWALEPSLVFLNHGSFGAAPRRVLGAQQAWRERIEMDPVRYFVEHHHHACDHARRALAAFVGLDGRDGCSWECLAPVTNATTGVATVFANLLREGALGAGDEVLITDHEYPACQNIARDTAARAGASVVCAEVPFPLPADDGGTTRACVDAISQRATERTKVLLVSHASSPTGFVLPVAEIIRAVRGRAPRVRVLVDGAHGVGFVPELNLATLGADYYTSNCHKWLCTPKGAAFLYVRPGLREGFRPLVLSNNAESPKRGRAQFLTEFDYQGTHDPTAFLCIPDAIAALGGMFADGWAGVFARNHELMLHGRRVLCDALKLSPPVPEAMLASLCTLVLGAGRSGAPSRYGDPLQDALLDRWRIQVPVWNWTFGPSARSLRLVRISAQVYNSPAQYEYLAHALRAELEREAGA